ncbi:MAG: hypothetical protein SOZ17_06295 [Agathobacter sp.]|nr:hypothetical protein [Agathobacter sp.]
MKKEKKVKDLERMYYLFAEYENSVHEQNLKKIRIGIRCIWIVPAIFLLLMLFTGSSKIIFLVLWIVSLFGISVYLIGVEYSDYQLQKKINEIKGAGEREMDSLLEVPEIVEIKMQQAMERLENLELAATEEQKKLEDNHEEHH